MPTTREGPRDYRVSRGGYQFVDCAVAADAEYIVTNDTHFKVLKHIDWPKLNVIAIKEFARQLE